MTIPPGWHPDPTPPPPGQPQLVRWWDGQQWTEHVQPMTAPVAPMASYDVGLTPDGAKLSSWGRRVVAYLIDGLITGTITALIAWHWVAHYLDDTLDRIDDTFRTGSATPSPFDGLFDSWDNLVAIGLIGIVVFTLYNGGFLRWAHGATLGKMALGIRVRMLEADTQLEWDAIGKRISVQLIPSIGTLVPLLGSASGIFGWIDDLWPLWDAKNQALHDKWPGTVVVHR